MGTNARSVDPKSGKVIWSRDLHEARKAAGIDDVLTPPAIVNGKVFIGTASDEVYALWDRTGDVLWKVEFPRVHLVPTYDCQRAHIRGNRPRQPVLPVNRRLR